MEDRTHKPNGDDTMDNQVYQAIVESAFDELIATLKRDEARRRLRRKKHPLYRIWNLASDELTGALYNLLLTRPHPSDSLMVRAIYCTYNFVGRLHPCHTKSFKRLDDCLWKQWITIYHRICEKREFVAVPVIYRIAVQREMAPKWKFRILTQRFAREVFDQTIGGISMYECRERSAQTDAVSYAISKVFGLESSRFTLWCIRQCRIDVKGFKEDKRWLVDFCLQFLAEMFHDQERAMVQLCDRYSEFNVVPVRVHPSPMQGITA